MAGKVLVTKLQIGDSPTATQNFLLSSNNDGTMKLARGNDGATTDVITVGSGGVTGIKFDPTQSASVDVNTLDDYEEGSWTPTFALATPGTSSFTYTVQTGLYTKIGRLVTVNFDVGCSAASAGTGSGQLSIAGLPFSGAGSGVCGYVNGFTTLSPTVVALSTNTMQLYSNSPTAGTTALVQTHFGATMRTTGTATFIV